MSEQVPDDTTRESLCSRLGDAATVLVYTPSFESGATHVCKELLVREDPADQTVLAVTYRQSPRAWVEDWYDEIGTDPADGAVIGVGDRGQLGGDAVPPETEHWTLTDVDNASDLTGLGVRLSEFLTGRYDTGQPGPALCFDSVTHLLQYADLESAFRFLHVVTGRIRNAGARGHFHVDPSAHDAQEMATLMGLFDAVLEPTDDGWTVRSR